MGSDTVFHFHQLISQGTSRFIAYNYIIKSKNSLCSLTSSFHVKSRNKLFNVLFRLLIMEILDFIVKISSFLEWPSSLGSCYWWIDSWDTIILLEVNLENTFWMLYWWEIWQCCVALITWWPVRGWVPHPKRRANHHIFTLLPKRGAQIRQFFFSLLQPPNPGRLAGSSAAPQWGRRAKSGAW